MTTAFDPQSFLDAQITEVSIKRPPLPVGDYTGIIGELTSRTWQGKTDPTKSGIAFDVKLVIDIPAEVQSEMGVAMPNLTLKDSIMLDLTENGTIDMAVGKNGGLRRYREALDMNKPGQVFSPQKMVGQPLVVRVKHDLWEDNILEKVGGVAKLA